MIAHLTPVHFPCRPDYDHDRDHDYEGLDRADHAPLGFFSGSTCRGVPLETTSVANSDARAARIAQVHRQPACPPACFARGLQCTKIFSASRLSTENWL